MAHTSKCSRCQEIWFGFILYRRYILHFSDITKPLHQLTQNLYGLINTVMPSTPSKTSWYKPQYWYTHSLERNHPFCIPNRCELSGLGCCILEQNGYMVVYASRALSKAKQQCSVIQKECLDAVFAMKQFRHTFNS